MEELLKKINGNLIEIKTKLDKDTFHISGGSNNIGQQNITYSTFKKPIINYKEAIDVKSKTILDKNSFYSRLFITIIFAFNLIVVLPLIYYFLTNDKDITLTSISIIYLMGTSKNRVKLQIIL